MSILYMHLNEIAFKNQLAVITTLHFSCEFLEYPRTVPYQLAKTARHRKTKSGTLTSFFSKYIEYKLTH